MLPVTEKQFNCYKNNMKLFYFSSPDLKHDLELQLNGQIEQPAEIVAKICMLIHDFHAFLLNDAVINYAHPALPIEIPAFLQHLLHYLGEHRDQLKKLTGYEVIAINIASLKVLLEFKHFRFIRVQAPRDLIYRLKVHSILPNP